MKKLVKNNSNNSNYDCSLACDKKIEVLNSNNKTSLF